MNLRRMNLRRSYEVIMPVILGSLKVLFILVKGQMQDAAGIAKAIPDFSTVAGAAPLTVEALTGETVMDSIRLLSSDAAASDLPNAGVAYAEGSIRVSTYSKFLKFMHHDDNYKYSLGFTQSW